MCESCVDRIFSQGPAPCPVAGCARTLRKQRFRKQTFEDLQIEREVDIRKTVAAVFNRRQEEFTTLLAYNNYLEEVETLTFNLIYNIDVATTQAKLAAYASQNAPIIASNARQASDDARNADAKLAAQMEQANLRREGARQEERDEKQEKAEARREFQDRIADPSTEDPTAVAKESQKVALKKSSARRNINSNSNNNNNLLVQKTGQQPSSKSSTEAGTASTPLFEIQGLKPVMMPSPQKAYDPFGGLSMAWEYHTPRTDFESPYLLKARTDPAITTGGYDVREFCTRALLEAFEGFGVFIDEEIGERDRASGKEVATMAAAAAAAGDNGGGDGEGGSRGGDGLDDDLF